MEVFGYVPLGNRWEDTGKFPEPQTGVLWYARWGNTQSSTPFAYIADAIRFAEEKSKEVGFSYVSGMKPDGLEYTLPENPERLNYHHYFWGYRVDYEMYAVDPDGLAGIRISKEPLNNLEELREMPTKQ